jgi:hypothetical protein
MEMRVGIILNFERREKKQEIRKIDFKVNLLHFR